MCPAANVRAAREEAWEGENPGIRSGCSSNPRWERRLLRFLEFEGVGRAMDDGVHEEESRAASLDGWIPRRAEEWVAPRGARLIPVSFRFLSFLFPKLSC